MFSQQNQIFAQIEKYNIKQHLKTEKSWTSKAIQSSSSRLQKSKQNLKNSQTKFDIKKFQQNILNKILSQNQPSTKKKSVSNKNQSHNSLSHINSFKQISNQRKLSRSKSKSKKDLNFKKIPPQTQIFSRTHNTNTKILRQKLLNSLNQFDDYLMINIEDSIPILNKARILKILTSLQETKAKIQSRQLPEGRIKQEAKFIYFLWKMIDQESITTRHLKEIIILLNEMNKSELVDAFGELYSREGEVVKMFVECWMKLKMDKFFYESSSSKEKFTSNVLSSSKKNNPNIPQEQKTVKKFEHYKTQASELKNSENQPNEQSFKDIKLLNPNEEKKLISRLYDDRKDFMSRRERVKTLHDEEKQNLEVQKCTFKPHLTASSYQRSSSKSSLISKIKFSKQEDQNNLDENNSKQQKKSENNQGSKSKVKGFQKAVKRMKNGHSQTKLKQQLLAYYSVGENYEKIKQKPMNPPKFLEREKEKKQEMILFVIEFQIGRHKVKVKIHPTDTEMSVSKKIAKIYGLKPEQEDQIREIVSMELNNYYKKIQEEVSEFFDS